MLNVLITDIAYTQQSDMESVITFSSESRHRSAKSDVSVELPIEVRIVNICSDILSDIHEIIRHMVLNILLCTLIFGF